MIGHALEIIFNELNAFVSARSGHDDLVVMERLVDGKGEFTPRTMGKICCSLVNLEQERHVKYANGSAIAGSLGAMPNRDMMVNLYLLFAVNTPTDGSTNQDYLQGLHKLSLVITFFHEKRVFTHQNTPAMHLGLEQLNMELYPLSIENQNHLWAGLGAKYLPSALYKLGVVALSDDTTTLAPLISTVQLDQGIAQ